MARQSFIIAILLVIAATTLLAQQKLSLTVDKAVAIGLENSKALHSSLMSVEYADAKSSETSALMLPSIKFSGSYTRLSAVDPIILDFPAYGTLQEDNKTVAFTSVPYQLGANVVNNYSTKLTLQQPIFTGWKLRGAANAADYAAQATNQDYQKDRSDLIYGVKSAYWNLYKAIESKKVIDENVTMIKAHLQDVQNFFQQGIVTKNEVLKVEVQLSNVQVMQLDAENNVRLAGLALNNTLGIPLSTDVTLADTVSTQSNEFGDVSGLVDKAFLRRPEMQGMQYRVKAGESAVTMARSGWFPQIYLVGDYLYARPNSRIFPAVDEFRDTWDVSLAVSLDIWNWGTTVHQTDEAQAQLAQANDGLAQLRDGITLEVTQNYLNYNESRERITVAQKGVAQAEENYRITDEKFKSGLALNSDLLDAETALLQARWNYIQALVDHELAGARLQKAVGEDQQTENE